MTSNEIPIGQVESEELEFKDARVLDGGMSKLLTTIVAMRNSNGGQIWVGITEKDERAVGAETIKDVDTQIPRIWNAIHDSVKPRLNIPAVQIESVKSGELAVIRISVVGDPTKKLTALRVTGGAWVVPERVHSSNRPLDWIEIQTRIGENHGGGRVALDKSRQVLDQHQREFLANPQDENFWIEIVPTIAIRVDIQKLGRKHASEFRELDAGLGNFSMMARCDGPELRENRIELTSEPLFALSIFEDGRIQLRSRLSLQRFGDRVVAGTIVKERQVSDEPVLELHPLELIALAVMPFRWAAKQYKDSAADGPQSQVLSRFLLTKLTDVGLRSFSPAGMGRMWNMNLNPPKVSRSAVSGLDSPPLEYSLEEVVKSPELCAAQILRRIYASFGMDEENIPREIDLQTGRVLLPGA